MVARPGSSPGGCLAGPGVPRPRLMVQRLGRGLGCSSRRGGRFWLVVSGGHLPLDQYSGAIGSRTRSPSLSPSCCRLHGRHLRRQLHGGGLPAELRMDSFCISQRDCVTHSSLGGVSLSRSGPSVYHGLEQCPSRCPVPAQLSQDSEWTLKMEVFEELWRHWLVMVNLFATSANRRCSLYLQPYVP